MTLTDEEVIEKVDEYLHEHYPTASVNIGWFVDEVTNQFGTKVYGHGVLTTDMNTGKHTFEEF